MEKNFRNHYRVIFLSKPRIFHTMKIDLYSSKLMFILFDTAVIFYIVIFGVKEV